MTSMFASSATEFGELLEDGHFLFGGPACNYSTEELFNPQVSSSSNSVTTTTTTTTTGTGAIVTGNGSNFLRPRKNSIIEARRLSIGFSSFQGAPDFAAFDYWLTATTTSSGVLPNATELILSGSAVSDSSNNNAHNLAKLLTSNDTVSGTTGPTNPHFQPFYYRRLSTAAIQPPSFLNFGPGSPLAHPTIISRSPSPSPSPSLSLSLSPSPSSLASVSSIVHTLTPNCSPEEPMPMAIGWEPSVAASSPSSSSSSSSSSTTSSSSAEVGNENGTQPHLLLDPSDFFFTSELAVGLSSRSFFQGEKKTGEEGMEEERMRVEEEEEEEVEKGQQQQQQQQQLSEEGNYNTTFYFHSKEGNISPSPSSSSSPLQHYQFPPSSSSSSSSSTFFNSSSQPTATPPPTQLPSPHHSSSSSSSSTTSSSSSSPLATTATKTIGGAITQTFFTLEESNPAEFRKAVIDACERIFSGEGPFTAPSPPLISTSSSSLLSPTAATAPIFKQQRQPLPLLLPHSPKRASPGPATIVKKMNTPQRANTSPSSSSSSSSSTSGVDSPKKSKQQQKTSIHNNNKRSLEKHDNNTSNKKIQVDLRRTKTSRLKWSSELQDIFTATVERLGVSAVPSTILEEMNVAGLTRENVASHLQKYRQHHVRGTMGRMQKKKKAEQAKAAAAAAAAVKQALLESSTSSTTTTTTTTIAASPLKSEKLEDNNASKELCSSSNSMAIAQSLLSLSTSTPSRTLGVIGDSSTSTAQTTATPMMTMMTTATTTPSASERKT